jgi:hypothetical protein
VAANEKLGGQFMHHRRGYAGKTTDQYDYVKKMPTEQWDRDLETIVSVPKDRSLLSMTVEHQPTHNAYAGIPGETRPRRDWEEQEHVPLPHEIEAAKADFEAPHPDNPDQPKLFGMHTRPGTSKVDYMVGPKEGRAHAMTAIGIAQNRTIQDFGRSLMPATDLSPHSHKLAQHLAEKAGTKAPPVSGPTNGMTFNDEPGMYHHRQSDRVVGPEEVRQGRNLTRRVIKGGNPDPQGTGPASSALDKLSIHQWRQQRPGRQPRRRPNPDQGTLF